MPFSSDVPHLAGDGSPFVRPDSIVRRIWGDGDLVLLVFAGAAAEFALNRAVDWLFFTGKVPQDPLGRLFSTAAYAQQIILADRAGAEQTFARIRAAHGAVEGARGARMPDWAHRDVLYLLVAYSERAYETLHHPLTGPEREDLWADFRRVGFGLGIPELPAHYAEWQVDRQRHLERDLTCGQHTRALYAAYRQHLGPWRYLLLRQLQGVLVPHHVRDLLSLPGKPWLRGVLPLYPMVARLGLRSALRQALIPPAHLDSVRRLDLAST